MENFMKSDSFVFIRIILSFVWTVLMEFTVVLILGVAIPQSEPIGFFTGIIYKLSISLPSVVYLSIMVMIIMLVSICVDMVYYRETNIESKGGNVFKLYAIIKNLILFLFNIIILFIIY